MQTKFARNHLEINNLENNVKINKKRLAFCIAICYIIYSQERQTLKEGE